MRTVIYARYSSENQREASIEDQLRICKERIAAEKWDLINVFQDKALSGASSLRPGYQALLEGARQGKFDVVVAEALDRLSRDQEDVAAFYKRMRFAGVKIITLAEGEISELHVGLKGTMNALFLKDLAEKVRRGLEGRVLQGRSGGGLPFGYRVVRQLGEDGELVRGQREIDRVQAQVIVRIFESFGSGMSPRAIARELNAEKVPGPGGREWSDTTIRGHGRRGCGILRNEIYIGRLVWNKQRFLKDPQSGRRVTRINPESERVTADVPEWRIVPQDLWDKVQTRMETLRTSPTAAKIKDTNFWERRRPKHILTGLVKCAECGGDYSPSGRHYLSCSTARRKGTCDNRRGIPREVLEGLVIDALKQHLMAPELVKEFIRAYHAELNTLRANQEVGLESDRRELSDIERKLTGLINAIADGLRAPGLQDRLDQLTNRKSEIQGRLKAALKPMPRLHPKLADVYREKVLKLQEALADPATHDEALETMRGLVEKVIVRNIEAGFEIELVGEIANMLTFSGGPKTPEFRSSVKVVAGPRYHRSPSATRSLGLAERG
jgi:site-specific DNA recombinase